MIQSTVCWQVTKIDNVIDNQHNNIFYIELENCIEIISTTHYMRNDSDIFKLDSLHDKRNDFKKQHFTIFVPLPS